MSTGQYRALVAYLSFWPAIRGEDFRFENAIDDIGITLTKDEVLHELFKASWTWNENDKTMIYDDD